MADKSGDKKPGRRKGSAQGGGGARKPSSNRGGSRGSAARSGGSRTGGGRGSGQSRSRKGGRSGAPKGGGSGARRDKPQARSGRDGAPGEVRSDQNYANRGGNKRSGAAAQLPHWLVEDMQRTTAAARLGPALESVADATRAFEEGRYKPAQRHAEAAKSAAPRNAPVREILALAAYRAGDWQTAIRELRAYRRMSGDTMHIPIEMDVLRALGRKADVEKAWKELQHHDGPPAALGEGRVVYASFLADEGRLEEAWRLIKPGKIAPGAREHEHRRWYVAARVAAMAGDPDTATQLRDAILTDDPGFPGIDELEQTIAKARRSGAG